MVYSLIIETALAKSCIALGKEKELIALKNFPSHEKTSRTLLQEIASLLRSQSLDLSHLCFIAVTTGPGSYTGIRAGVSVAQALCYGLKIPLVSFSSLEGFAPENKGSFCSIIDAKAGGLYYLLGEKKTSISYHGSPAQIPLNEVNKIFSSTDYLISTDYKILQDRLPGYTFLPPYRHEKRLLENSWEQYEKKNFIKEKIEIYYLKNL